MRNRRRSVTSLAALIMATLSLGQDGDLLTSTGFGRGWFETVALSTTPGSPLVAPYNLTVGTAPLSLATLNSRGDHLPVPDAFNPGVSWCTFRTDMSDGRMQNWSMVRHEDDSSPPQELEVGRLYHGSSFNWFAVQAPQPNGDLPGILWLENAETDGFMLRANGLQDPVNTYSLRCDGFASLGIRNDGTTGTQTMPSRARLHLVDINGDEDAPWRPYYRNGTLFTGNHDMGYVGHRYYDNGHEEPWNYERDHSDLLISAGEDDLEDALR